MEFGSIKETDRRSCALLKLVLCRCYRVLAPVGLLDAPTLDWKGKEASTGTMVSWPVLVLHVLEARSLSIWAPISAVQVLRLPLSNAGIVITVAEFCHAACMTSVLAENEVQDCE